MPWNQPPSKPVSARAAMNARSLRRALIEPEKRLWWHLRKRLPIAQTHFRRQVAIGSYVADFCCQGTKLIIEIDGGQHTADDTVAYDNRRTAYLEAQGFRVLRFDNAEVMRNMSVVLNTIHAALVRTTPTPYPSPQGGGDLET